MSRECTQPQAEKPCYRCGKVGHLSRECPEGGAPGMGAGQECYKCGKVGHIARNCNSYGGGFGGGAGGGGAGGGYGGGSGGGFGGPRGQTCYSCGGYGHMSRDCTQGQKCYNCKLLVYLVMWLFMIANSPCRRRGRPPFQGLPV